MNSTTATPHDRRPIRRPKSGGALGLAAIATALLTFAACGSDAATPVSPTPSTLAPTTVASSSVDPTTSAAPATSATTSVTATTVARPTAAIDQLVDTGGPRMHVRCVGHGETTVVLIAGFGSDSTAWAKVEPAVAPDARVCSYDRPGTGTSDPATAITTFRTEASDLHQLLHTIGEPGPYVVVGHSFGGAEAITFASVYPNEVTGLVLVDASPITWPAALCAVADDGTDAAAMLRSTCTNAFQPAGNSEHLDVIPGFADVARITSLGALPIAVITATNRVFPAGLAAGEMTRLTEAWNQGQQAWVQLSTDAHLLSVDNTGHHIELDQPDVVIAEITHLLP